MSSFYFFGGIKLVLYPPEDGLYNLGAKQYLVLDDLLGDLGCLGSHGFGGAQASLGGTQPFSQRLQGFMELKSQNLQLLQLPLPEGQESGDRVVLLLVFYCFH